MQDASESSPSHPGLDIPTQVSFIFLSTSSGDSITFIRYLLRVYQCISAYELYLDIEVC